MTVHHNDIQLFEFEYENDHIIFFYSAPVSWDSADDDFIGDHFFYSVNGRNERYHGFAKTLSDAVEFFKDAYGIESLVTMEHLFGMAGL